MDEGALLRAMLDFHTPSGAEAPLVEYLVEELRALGFSTGRDAVGNLHAALGEGGPRIALVGHLDTVPGHLPVGEDSEAIWGRGAVDAKGALSALAFSALDALDRGFEGRLEVVGTVGEEADFRGSRYLSRSRPPDAAVVGEPSGWDALVLGYKGYVGGTFTVEAEASHPTSPRPSALDGALDFTQAFRQHFPRPPLKGDFGVTSGRILRVEGEGHGGRERVRVDFSVRPPPGADPRRLEDLLGTLGGGGRLETSPAVPGVVVPKDSPWVAALLSAIRLEGGRPSLKLRTGTSDMNVLASSWRIPMVTYGPGDSRLDHGPEERMGREELAKGRRVLGTALLSLPQRLHTFRR
jgi:LysW-gamma-L-lysine carboxypeptidase